MIKEIYELQTNLTPVRDTKAHMQHVQKAATVFLKNCYSISQKPLQHFSKTAAVFSKSCCSIFQKPLQYFSKAAAAHIKITTYHYSVNVRHES